MKVILQSDLPVTTNFRKGILKFLAPTNPTTKVLQFLVTGGLAGFMYVTPAPLRADSLAKDAGCTEPPQSAIDYLVAVITASQTPSPHATSECQGKIARYLYRAIDSSYYEVRKSDAEYRAGRNQNPTTKILPRALEGQEISEQREARAKSGKEEKGDSISTLAKPGFNSIIMKSE